MKKPDRFFTKRWQIIGFCLLITLVACKTSGKLVSGKILQNMEEDINYLASDELEGREIGSPGERLAGEYIAMRMEKAGLLPAGDDGTYYQHFRVDRPTNPHNPDSSPKETLSGRNVLGWIDHGAPYTVVIGAHYDHLGYGPEGSLHTGDPAIHNGADDNASGIAGMLALISHLKKKYTNNNYLFLAFSGEEKGLWGSNYYCKNPLIPLEKVNYMINMDMVGRLNEEKKLSINGVGTSPEWKIAIENIKSPIEPVTTESGIGASDHTSFYLSDIPAVHFFTGAHGDYHRPSDDADKINYPGLTEVMDYIGQVIRELDDEGKIAFVKTKDDQPARRTFNVTLGVIPDYLFSGKGMRIDGVREDRPAAKAGMQKGDIVIKMGDFEVVGMQSYMELLSKFKPGQKIMVTIKRDEELINKEVQF